MPQQSSFAKASQDTDPKLDELLHEPEFQALLKTVGLDVWPNQPPAGRRFPTGGVSKGLRSGTGSKIGAGASPDSHRREFPIYV